MEIAIEIEDKTGQLEFEIFEELYVDEREVTVGEGIIANYISTVGNTVEFIVALPMDFTRSTPKVISSWLYCQLKDRDIDSLRIEKEETKVDPEEIEKILRAIIGG